MLYLTKNGLLVCRTHLHTHALAIHMSTIAMNPERSPQPWLDGHMLRTRGRRGEKVEELTVPVW